MRSERKKIIRRPQLIVKGTPEEVKFIAPKPKINYEIQQKDNCPFKD